MKKLFVLALLAFSSNSMALVEVGQKPQNYCWKDAKDAQVCLDDPSMQYKVRVLLYNAGWCPPCNSEFSTIASATNQFKGKRVVFISLSCEGWQKYTPATKTFLNEWSTKHKLDQAQASFVVADSKRNAGQDFFENPGIPNVVILDIDGLVSYKAEMPGVAKIVSEVKRVLPTVAPQPIPSN